MNTSDFAGTTADNPLVVILVGLGAFVGLGLFGAGVLLEGRGKWVRMMAVPGFLLFIASISVAMFDLARGDGVTGEANRALVKQWTQDEYGVTVSDDAARMIVQAAEDGGSSPEETVGILGPDGESMKTVVQVDDGGGIHLLVTSTELERLESAR